MDLSNPYYKHMGCLLMEAVSKYFVYIPRCCIASLRMIVYNDNYTS